jgi:streptogramin lyase
MIKRIDTGHFYNSNTWIKWKSKNKGTVWFTKNGPAQVMARLLPTWGEVKVIEFDLIEKGEA